MWVQPVNDYVERVWSNSARTDLLAIRGTGWAVSLGDIAYFEEQFEEQEVDVASTPEPSLIFGFITLSGLMLGSKRKTKG